MERKLIGKKFSSKAAMHLSIEEAKKGKGWVSPNPPVGCVILDKNQCFLSSAYHKAYGKHHAEMEALKKIKNKKSLKGAHVYVTLEPCAHYGKTPPCVEALIKYPLSSVHYGQKDCNPKTRGLGIKKLKDKGIATKKYTYFKNSIKDLYEVFNYNKIQQKTFVSLKVATSLDGMIGLQDGSSQWITSQSARDYVSVLRAHNDAVLIGVGTFLEDNPKLNSRKPPFHRKKNKVVILDPSGHSLDLLEKSNLSKVRSLSHIIVVTKDKPSVGKRKMKVIRCLWNASKNQFDLKKLKSILYLEFGIGSVLVEGGANTFSSFLEQEEAEILYQFLSPCILGGEQGISWSEQLKIADLRKKKVVQLVDHFYKEKDLFLKFSFSKNLKSD